MRIEELSRTDTYLEPVQRLGCLRGIAAHTALLLCVEVGDFRRFATAQQFASYLGLVPGERSSGDKQQYTGITKAGNSHLRKLLVEAAQVFSRSATKSGKSAALKERQAKCDSVVVAYADKANTRLKKILSHCTEIQSQHSKSCRSAGVGLLCVGNYDGTCCLALILFQRILHGQSCVKGASHRSRGFALDPCFPAQSMVDKESMKDYAEWYLGGTNVSYEGSAIYAIAMMAPLRRSTTIDSSAGGEPLSCGIQSTYNRVANAGICIVLVSLGYHSVSCTI